MTTMFISYLTANITWLFQKPRLLPLLLVFVLPLALATSYDLQLFTTSAEGFSEYFQSPNGTRIGMSFQNAVYTSKGGERIGTNQGYSMWFPSDPFMMEHNAANMTGVSVEALFKMPTRTFFLMDGTITTVNEAIVGATGAYSSFTGGNMFENATGSDPYEADLYFVRPSSTSSGVYHYLSAGSVASSLILWVTAAVFRF
jgi:hypothetical protein